MIHMKKVVCSIILLLGVSEVYAETDSCFYTLKVNDGKAFSIPQYSDFLQNEFRPQLSKNEGSFNVVILQSCTGLKDKNIIIGFDRQTYIMKIVNDRAIHSKLKRYEQSDLLLGKDKLDSSFETFLNEDVSNTDQLIQKQNALKFFTFIFSDAARYEDIFNVSDHLLNTGCTYQRDVYKGLIRS
jgi:hypothetical protein